jgi:hypothetical protein
VGFQPAQDKDGLEARSTRNNLGIFLFGSPLYNLAAHPLITSIKGIEFANIAIISIIFYRNSCHDTAINDTENKECAMVAGILAVPLVVL